MVGDISDNAKSLHIHKIEDGSQRGEPRQKKTRIDDTGEIDEEELFGD